jgi:hypothetical protein
MVPTDPGKGKATSGNSAHPQFVRTDPASYQILERRADVFRRTCCPNDQAGTVGIAPLAATARPGGNRS